MIYYDMPEVPPVPQQSSAVDGKTIGQLCAERMQNAIDGCNECASDLSEWLLEPNACLSTVLPSPPSGVQECAFDVIEWLFQQNSSLGGFQECAAPAAPSLDPLRVKEAKPAEAPKEPFVLGGVAEGFQECAAPAAPSFDPSRVKEAKLPEAPKEPFVLGSVAEGFQECAVPAAASFDPSRVKEAKPPEAPKEETIQAAPNEEETIQAAPKEDVPIRSAREGSAKQHQMKSNPSTAEGTPKPADTPTEDPAVLDEEMLCLECAPDEDTTQEKAKPAKARTACPPGCCSLTSLELGTNDDGLASLLAYLRPDERPRIAVISPGHDALLQRYRGCRNQVWNHTKQDDDKLVDACPLVSADMSSSSVGQSKEISTKMPQKLNTTKLDMCGFDEDAAKAYYDATWQRFREEYPEASRESISRGTYLAMMNDIEAGRRYLENNMQ